MDVAFLSRLQFGLTIGFHFLFPPITIGLAWLLVVVEFLGWRRQSPPWRSAGRFFGKLLGLTFAMGVATGIVMEFQFGTNWARYSGSWATCSGRRWPPRECWPSSSNRPFWACISSRETASRRNGTGSRS